MKESTKETWTIILSSLVPIALLIFSIMTYVSGWENASKINYLKENGQKVLVTVTDIEWVDNGENDTAHYTFSYEVNGKNYSYYDSSDRDFQVGEQFSIYVDPNQPDEFVLPKQSMFFSFLLFLLSVSYLLIFSNSFKRIIPYAYIGEGCVMIITGILLQRPGMVVLSLIFVVIVMLLWRIIRKKRSSKNKKA